MTDFLIFFKGEKPSCGKCPEEKDLIRVSPYELAASKLS